MTPERWAKVERLYHAALTRSGEARAAFLAEACAGDDGLRREVESLVMRSGDSGDFLGVPAIAMAAQLASAPDARLTMGQRIGVYQLQALLGAGGMGEVYRARDTRLGRDVAIKILPPAFTADPERRARFEREARMLATLNHPHIGAIYGFEDSDGVRALVLELVEGQTLADRIARGPLPIAEALASARQIADALDAAHEKGIVHRDLKPANIKITPEGVVKVLDFGLAKAGTGPGLAPDLTQSPTMTVGETRDGVILGTAAYMSPEQARGQAVDKRTDIWAFGCVLYEMLTGRAAFGGETISDTIAAILEREPDWTALPEATSPAVVHLLRRCLDKDPKRRLRDIGDARVELETSSKAGDIHSRPPNQSSRRWSFAVVALVSVVGTLMALAAVRYSRPTAPAASAELRLDVVAPGVLDPFSLALSPNGRQLAFVATTAEGSRLWVRPLDQSSAKPLPGTGGAKAPFWAADGSAIGFFANGKLVRVDVAGGSPRILADAIDGAGGTGGGTWSRDDVILFVSNGQLFKIAAAGGEVSAVSSQNAALRDHQLTYPQFLEDGRRFLVVVGGVANQLAVASLDRPGLKPLFQVRSSFEYSSARLFYVRQGALVVSSFDANREELVGPPTLVADSVAVNPAGLRAAAFAVSMPGVVAYQAAGQRYRWAWLDRAGKQVATASDSSDVLPLGQDPALSIDGRRLAVVRGEPGKRELWVIDTLKGVPTRLTFGTRAETDPIWSPDGRQIAFRSDMDLYAKPSSGTGQDDVLLESPLLKWPQDWSSDGRFILYAEVTPRTGRDLWVLPVAGDRKPYVIANTKFSEWNGQFSPDGRWIAYQSDESGRDEVYMRQSSGAGARQRVSANGGMMPRWRHDGRELYFISSDGRLLAAPVLSRGPNLDTGAPEPLFQTGIGPTVLRTSYSVGVDGRFLFYVPEEGGVTSPITVIVNWSASKTGLSQ